jgi:hypothetical protein
MALLPVHVIGPITLKLPVTRYGCLCMLKLVVSIDGSAAGPGLAVEAAVHVPAGI